MHRDGCPGSTQRNCAVETRDGKELEPSKNEPKPNLGFAKNRTEPNSNPIVKNVQETEPKPKPDPMFTELEPNTDLFL